MKQLIYFRVMQGADQLFELRLYYSCVLEELKPASICLNKNISLLDEQLNVSSVPL